MQHPAHTEQKTCLGKKLLWQLLNFPSHLPCVCLLHYSPLRKLEEEWVQALRVVISGIVWVDKRYLWLVDSTKGNH